MYHELIDFLRALSAEHRVLWALFTLGVVGGTSLALFGCWELVLRFFPQVVPTKNKNKGQRG